MSIRSELEKLLKTKQKAGEADEAYAARLVIGANKVPEDQWESELSDTTQTWVNDQLELKEKGSKVAPLPDEGKEVSSGKPASEEESSEETEGEAEDGEAKEAKASKESDVKNGKSNSKKAKTGKAKTAKVSGGKRGRKGPYEDEAKITILAKENPKRAGTSTAKQFAKLKTGMTVAEARKIGFSAKSLKWDADHEYISVK